MTLVEPLTKWCRLGGGTISGARVTKGRPPLYVASNKTASPPLLVYIVMS